MYDFRADLSSVIADPIGFAEIAQNIAPIACGLMDDFDDALLSNFPQESFYNICANWVAVFSKDPSLALTEISVPGRAPSDEPNFVLKEFARSCCFVARSLLGFATFAFDGFAESWEDDELDAFASLPNFNALAACVDAYKGVIDSARADKALDLHLNPTGRVDDVPAWLGWADDALKAFEARYRALLLDRMALMNLVVSNPSPDIMARASKLHESLSSVCPESIAAPDSPRSLFDLASVAVVGSLKDSYGNDKSSISSAVKSLPIPNLLVDRIDCIARSPLVKKFSSLRGNFRRGSYESEGFSL